MIITCEACDTRFNVDETLLKSTGSKVRCSGCKAVFLAYPPDLPVATPDDEEPEDMLSDADDTDELGLDMGIEIGTREEGDGDEAEAMAAPELEIEELEDLDLTDDEEAPTIEKTMDAGSEDQLDLGDLGLELDTDADGDGDEAEARAAPELEIEGIEDLDLTEGEEAPTIEKTMDAGSEDQLDLGDLELELDTDADGDGDDTGEAEDVDSLSEDFPGLDLTDMDDMLEISTPVDDEEADAASAYLESDDGEDHGRAQDGNALEADEMATIRDPDDTGAEATEPSESFSMGSDDEDLLFIEEDGLSADSTATDDESTPVAAIPGPVRKKPVSPLTAVLLIVLLLCGGGYAAISIFHISVPFVSEIFTSEDEGTDLDGNLNIMVLDHSYKIVSNAHAGRLLIITGRVRNDYADSRGFISVKGSLYSRGKILAKTEIVYCGNGLSDMDLANLELAAIQKRLKNRIGDNRSNIRLQPGKFLPFMIVFADLPENMEEFTLRVERSLKA